MGQPDRFIDPFGAPEIFCNDLAYLEMAGPGLVRFVLHAGFGQAEPVERLRVLLPTVVIPSAIARTTTFLACKAVRAIGPHSSVLL